MCIKRNNYPCQYNRIFIKEMFENYNDCVVCYLNLNKLPSNFVVMFRNGKTILIRLSSFEFILTILRDPDRYFVYIFEIILLEQIRLGK